MGLNGAVPRVAAWHGDVFAFIDRGLPFPGGFSHSLLSVCTPEALGLSHGCCCWVGIPSSRLCCVAADAGVLFHHFSVDFTSHLSGFHCWEVFANLRFTFSFAVLAQYRLGTSLLCCRAEEEGHVSVEVLDRAAS